MAKETNLDGVVGYICMKKHGFVSDLKNDLGADVSVSNDSEDKDIDVVDSLAKRGFLAYGRCTKKCKDGRVRMMKTWKVTKMAEDTHRVMISGIHSLI